MCSFSDSYLIRWYARAVPVWNGGNGRRRTVIWDIVMREAVVRLYKIMMLYVLFTSIFILIKYITFTTFLLYHFTFYNFFVLGESSNISLPHRPESLSLFPLSNLQPLPLLHAGVYSSSVISSNQSLRDERSCTSSGCFWGTPESPESPEWTFSQSIGT